MQPLKYRQVFIAMIANNSCHDHIGLFQFLVSRHFFLNHASPREKRTHFNPD